MRGRGGEANMGFSIVFWVGGGRFVWVLVNSLVRLRVY